MDLEFDLRSVDLRLLRSLLILMEERSVSRAAAQLNVSQPTMSHALGRLRRLFNDPLLLNSYGAMTPTTRGSEICTEVSDLLNRFDRILSPPEEFDPTRSRLRLAIIAPEFVGDVVIPAIMKRLQDEKCHMEVEFLATDPAEAFDLLEKGTASFRLGWWPDPAPSLRHKLLWTDRLVCVARPNHPRLSSPITTAEFLDARHVRVRAPGRSFSMATIDAAAARAGRTIHVGALVQNALTMANTVAATDMVGTMSERLTGLLSHIPLSTSPVPLDVPGINVALYWHERTHRDAAHKWFRTIICDTVQRR